MKNYKTKHMNLQLFAEVDVAYTITVAIDEETIHNVNLVSVAEDGHTPTWYWVIARKSGVTNQQFTKDANGLIKYNGYQLYYNDEEVREQDTIIDNGEYTLTIGLTETLVSELSKFPMTLEQYKNRKGMIPETAIPVITDIDTEITNLKTTTTDLSLNKQATLVNQENIKSINGTSILGSGNMNIRTYLPFPASWQEAALESTEDFCDVIDNDTSAVEGMGYLGELRLSDFHDNGINITNGEGVVEIFAGSTTGQKVIHISLSSGNTAPHRWEYTYWNGGLNTSGWIAFQTKLDIATASTAGIAKLGSETVQTIAANAVSSTENRTYAIQKNSSNQLVVNVPWVDSNTVYTNETAAENGTTNSLVTTGEKYNWNGKSVVSVSSTGTATDEVNYITVNGVERKIGGGSSSINYPTVTISLSQVISQEPVTVQLTSVQLNVFANNPIVSVDANELGMGVSLFYKGVWDSDTGYYFASKIYGQYYNQYLLEFNLSDSVVVVNNFDINIPNISPTQVSTGNGADEGKIIVMNNSGDGQLTPIKTINNQSIVGNGNIDTAELFYCTYGTTTYAEITAAITAGKLPVCFYDNKEYVYVGLSTTNRYTFESQLFDTYRYVSVNSSDSWNNGINNFEVTSNKVTSISSFSTNTQYPSAKAVYDAIEDVREVAEGKTASYICSDVTNTILNSQNNTITIASALTDINSQTITLNDLNIGDIIYITEIDVPDRWVSNITIENNTITGISLSKLETAKVPITSISVNNSAVSPSNGNVNISVPTITLNDSSSSTLSFYAPTSAGTNGQVLVSAGSGAPTWTSLTVNPTQDLTSNTAGTLDATAWGNLKSNHYATISSPTMTGLNSSYEFVNIKLSINSNNEYVKLAKNTTNKYSGLFFIEESTNLYEITVYYNGTDITLRCATIY